MGAKRPAARPGDAAVAPAGDHDLAVPEETGGAITAAQGWRAVGSVQQAVAVGVVHGAAYHKAQRLRPVVKTVMP
jgi:hypothetical protein